MNGYEILRFMGEIGARYTKHDIKLILRYFQKMISGGRVLMITEWKEGNIRKPCALIAYSICTPETFEKYHNKEIWHCKRHDLDGNVVYIEKLIARKWTKEMRKRFEEMITERHPQIEYGAWHRARKTGNQAIAVKRRLQYV